SQPTQVQAMGAWYAGNLVRWRNGLLEKWPRWQRLFADPFAAIIRRMHAWLYLDNHRNLFVATNLGVPLTTDQPISALRSQVEATGGGVVECGPVGGETFSVPSGSTRVTVNTSPPLPSS